jgi:hypothetical protein
MPSFNGNHVLSSIIQKQGQVRIERLRYPEHSSEIMLWLFQKKGDDLLAMGGFDETLHIVEF